MPLPPFVPASASSVAAFVAIVLGVLGAIVAGVYFAARQAGDDARRLALRTALGLAAWLGAFSAVTAAGALAEEPMRIMPYFATANLGALLFALSPMGRRLAQGVPLAALVGFQAFRLPLELVLHDWGRGGTIPLTMTWQGQNLDVVTGIVALVAAPLCRHPRLGRPAAWVANVVGLALLLNVARVAFLSAPLPFSWPLAVPLQLPLHLPYAWIVPVCVAGALAGHVVLTRKLLVPSA